MQSSCSVNTLNFAQLRPRLLIFAAIVAIHASLLLALQGQMIAAVDRMAPEPLILDLIEPAPIATSPQPQTVPPPEMPPPPKPVLQRVAKPRSSPPQPPARTEAVPETVAGQQEPAPSPTPVAVEPETTAAAPTQPVPTAEPQPAATTAPRFDAAYLNNPAPVYPRQARRAGEAGKVVLRVLVTPDGRAGEVHLRDSSGFDLLDEAAVAAVRQWRFVAARQGDAKVAAWVIVPLRFDLDT